MPVATNTPSLEPCERKLAWAYRHLELLQSKLSAPNDYSDHISFAQHFDPDARTIEVTIQGVPDLPSEWGLIAADYLQNVRAALNYLAWELSRWNLLREGETREPKRITQFPINTAAGKFDAHKLPDVHPDHVAVIRALQPSAIEVEIPDGLRRSMYEDLPADMLPESFYFRRDQRIANHPLTRLVKLSNQDKHWALPVFVLGAWESRMTGTPRPINCTFGNMAWGRMSPQLEDGAVWGTVYEVMPTGEGEPEVQVNDEITRAEVSIGGLWLPDLPAIGACAEDVIARFRGVFSSQGTPVTAD